MLTLAHLTAIEVQSLLIYSMVFFGTGLTIGVLVSRTNSEESAPPANDQEK